MERQVIEETIVNKSHSISNLSHNRFTYKDIKELGLQDDDIIEVGFQDEIEAGDSYTEACYILKVYRPRYETDEEMVKRKRNSSLAIRNAVENEHKRYLELKEKFEDTQSNYSIHFQRLSDQIYNFLNTYAKRDKDYKFTSIYHYNLYIAAKYLEYNAVPKNEIESVWSEKAYAPYDSKEGQKEHEEIYVELTNLKE